VQRNSILHAFPWHMIGFFHCCTVYPYSFHFNLCKSAIYVNRSWNARTNISFSKFDIVSCHWRYFPIVIIDVKYQTRIFGKYFNCVIFKSGSWKSCDAAIVINAAPLIFFLKGNNGIIIRSEINCCRIKNYPHLPLWKEHIKS